VCLDHAGVQDLEDCEGEDSTHDFGRTASVFKLCSWRVARSESAVDCCDHPKKFAVESTKQRLTRALLVRSPTRTRVAPPECAGPKGEQAASDLLPKDAADSRLGTGAPEGFPSGPLPQSHRVISSGPT
jgi:hypothetical protein